MIHVTFGRHRGRRLERVPASGVPVWVLHIDVSVALPGKDGRSELKIQPPVSWRRLDIAPRRRLAVTGILLDIGDGQSRGLVAEPYAAQKISDDPTSRWVVVEVDKPCRRGNRSATEDDGEITAARPVVIRVHWHNF